jgi:hypothetical protein
MGFFKDTKVQNLATEAQRAVDEGRRVFAPRLNTPGTHHNMSGSIAGWAEMVEGVEECGWRLAEWAVCVDSKGRPEAYPLFRR